MRYDDLLHLLGEFGRYQRVMYTLLCLPVMFVGIQIMSPVFTLAVPKHRCAIPGMINDTYEIQNEHHRSLVQFYIPTDEIDGGYAKCEIYRKSLPDTGILKANETDHYMLGDSNNDTMECNKWVFDTSVFENTAITDTQLVCARTIFRAHATTALNVGAIFSFLAGGPLADRQQYDCICVNLLFPCCETLVFDWLIYCIKFLIGVLLSTFYRTKKKNIRYGRKLVSMVDLVLMIVSSTVLVWLPNIYVFIAIRLVIGLGFGVFFNVIFVYALEFVGQSKRTVFGIFLNHFWAIGILFQSLLAYYIRSWRALQLATSLPLVGFLLYWWKLPNSGRWLFTKGYVDEGKKVMEDMARVNNVKVDVTNVSIDADDDKEMTQGWMAIELMRHKALALRSLVVWYNWLVVALLYYGLSLNVGNLGGDIFMNFAISAAVEFVAYTICIPGMYRMGRKKFYCFCMLLGGGVLLLVIFPELFGNKSTEWVVILFSMIGKLTSSAAYAVVYLYSAELFPTILRGTALGICAACATAGGFLAPYIVELANLLSGTYAKILPLIIFGVTSFTAGVLSLTLPETSNIKLPDTIKDMKLQKMQTIKSKDHLARPTTN